jgi:hypothetical protein
MPSVRKLGQFELEWKLPQASANRGNTRKALIPLMGHVPSSLEPELSWCRHGTTVPLSYSLVPPTFSGRTGGATRALAAAPARSATGWTGRAAY